MNPFLLDRSKKTGAKRSFYRIRITGTRCPKSRRAMFR